MANIKSQIKRNRQTVKRNLANRKVRSEIHTRTKNADAAIAAGADDADVLVRKPSPRSTRPRRTASCTRTRRLARRASSPSVSTPAHRAEHPRLAETASRYRRPLRLANRATSTSTTNSGGQSLVPRSDRSASARRSIARPSFSVPRRRLCCIAFFAGKVLPFIPSSAAADLSSRTSAPSRRNMLL